MLESQAAKAEFESILAAVLYPGEKTFDQLATVQTEYFDVSDDRQSYRVRSPPEAGLSQNKE